MAEWISVYNLKRILFFYTLANLSRLQFMYEIPVSSWSIDYLPFIITTFFYSLVKENKTECLVILLIVLLRNASTYSVGCCRKHGLHGMAKKRSRMMYYWKISLLGQHGPVSWNSSVRMILLYTRMLTSTMHF